MFEVDDTGITIPGPNENVFLHHLKQFVQELGPIVRPRPVLFAMTVHGCVTIHGTCQTNIDRPYSCETWYD